jgi:hypothetical protein
MKRAKEICRIKQKEKLEHEKRAQNEYAATVLSY